MKNTSIACATFFSASSGAVAAFLGVYNTFTDHNSTNSQKTEVIAGLIATAPLASLAIRDAIIIFDTELGKKPQYKNIRGKILSCFKKAYNKCNTIGVGEISG